MKASVRRHAAILGVGALSFAVSAALILSTRPYDPLLDSREYAQTAEGLLEGDGFVRPINGDVTAFRGPVYPLTLAAVFAVSGASYGVGQLAMAALGAITVMLLYLIVRELWGARPALLAGLLGAVFPPWIVLNAGFFTETPFLALELAVILLLLRFRDEPDRIRLPIVLGVLAGLAALTRSNGLLLLPLLAFALWGVARSDVRRALVAPAVMLVTGALVITPWTIRNAFVFDELVPTTTQVGYNLFSVFNERSRQMSGEYDPYVVEEEAGRVRAGRDLDEAAFEDALADAALEYAGDHPGYVIEAVVMNTLRTLDLAEGRFTGSRFYEDFGVRSSVATRSVGPGSYVLYGLALAGLVVMLRDRRLERPPWFFYVAPVVLLLSAAFAAGAMRFRAPLDPLLLAFAGLALAALTARVKRNQ